MRPHRMGGRCACAACGHHTGRLRSTQDTDRKAARRRACGRAGHVVEDAAPHFCLLALENALTPFDQIIEQLRSAQGQKALALARLSFCAGLATAASVAAGGCCLAQLGYVTVGGWGLVLSVPCGLLAPATALWRQRRAAPLRATPPDPQTLALLSAYAPELRSAVQSALELQHGCDAAKPLFSARLIEQHLHNTAQRLFAANVAGRWRRRNARRLGWCTCGSILTVLLAAAAAAVCQDGRRRLHKSATEPQAFVISASALVTDLSLHYTYPAYTRQPPRTVDGSDGSIEAVERSEVTLRARTHRPFVGAWMQLTQNDAEPAARLEPSRSEAQTATFVLPLLHDGTYRLIFDFGQGDNLADPTVRAVHVLADQPPRVVMSMPAADLTVRDNEYIEVQWRSNDDFNLQNVQLVAERAGAEPMAIALWTRPQDSLVEIQADGRYSWHTAALGLSPGDSVTFYVAAWDTDAVHGPKRGTSSSRTLTMYSPRGHHEELLQKCHAALDGLVDTLGLELERPLPQERPSPEAWPRAREALQDAALRATSLDAALAALVAELKDDPLAQPPVRLAFENTAAHVHSHCVALTPESAALLAAPQALRQQTTQRSAHLQRRFIAQLESDIIYLDDLLAVARIDELKGLAKDLLTDQRHLKELLEQVGQTSDGALKAQLQQGILALRQKMRDVLAKMSEVKQSLPGEYRNMEASSMLRLDEQIGRLDKQLAAGDLQSAAQELEQLANMVENMMQNLGEAQDQYGGERYDGMRRQLQSFADDLAHLEQEQQNLSERSDALLDAYRQKMLTQMAKNQRDFVDKARRLTQQALSALDTIGHDAQLAQQHDQELDAARQALLDVDSLLGHKDFAEANARVVGAQDSIEALAKRLGPDQDAQLAATGLGLARKSCRRAEHNAQAVGRMLAPLFEDPERHLTPEQKLQMAAMGQKQQALQAQAQKLDTQMQQLAEHSPLFGDDSQKRLNTARAQMQSAAHSFGQRAVPQSAAGSRQAAQTLGQLQQSLKQAAQSGGPGMPLPLGSRPGAGAEPGGAFDAEGQQQVAIPAAPRGPDGPNFRRELMEAAKQKAPAYYEDAVRRYYNELIR